MTSNPTLALALVLSLAGYLGSAESELGPNGEGKHVHSGLHEDTKPEATPFNKALPADGNAHSIEAFVHSEPEVMEFARVRALDREMRWSPPRRVECVTEVTFSGDFMADMTKDEGYFSKFNGKMKRDGGDGGDEGEGEDGEGGEVDLTWSFLGKLPARDLDFLKDANVVIDPRTESLNVSNYVTTDTLPTKADTEFDTEMEDPDNFRLEVDDPAADGESVDVDLQVNDAEATTYTLDFKEDGKFRGVILRLVSDSVDAGASGHGDETDPDDQTILVELGDNVTATYDPGDGDPIVKELMVGRPVEEDDNGANQLRHDIRVLRLRIVVFEDGTGSPEISEAQLAEEIAVANQRLAQSTIRVETTSEFDEEADVVSLPASLSDGYSFAPGRVTTPTADETAVADLKDGNDDTIDVFYVPNVLGSPATAYPADRNSTDDDKFNNFIVIEYDNGGGSNADRDDEPFILPHEIMHILLDSPHRSGEPETALFDVVEDQGNIVGAAKRIGPYPDADSAGVGNDDTTTIRNAAESLPD